MKLGSFPLLILLAVGFVNARAAESVKFTDANGSVRVEIDGKLFTEYHYANVPRPVLYPVIGPTGAGMTRNYPMQDVPGEEHDHPHHRGIQWSHTRINGVSTWGESTSKAGVPAAKTVHGEFLELKGGPDSGVIRTRNQIVSGTGKPVCDEFLTLRFYPRKAEQIMDYDVELRATHGELVLGDDKDGGMAIRVAETMRVIKPRQKGQKKIEPGEGHIITSEGARDGEAWGKRAKWCDYFGPVEGRTVGVAIFDHPSNPRHPTWWHVRTYGLFSANPFGIASFENKPDKDAGKMIVPAGKSVTFRYRFYFHEGDEKSAKVEEQYAAYVKGSGRAKQ